MADLPTAAAILSKLASFELLESRRNGIVFSHVPVDVSNHARVFLSSVEADIGVWLSSK